MFVLSFIKRYVILFGDDYNIGRSLFAFIPVNVSIYALAGTFRKNVYQKTTPVALKLSGVVFILQDGGLD